MKEQQYSPMIVQALEKITALQPETENQVWMVGEQLKDFCRSCERDAEIILQDLEVPEMTLANAEKQIAAYAKSKKVGNCGCCPPKKAEEILRKFYGLPERDESHNGVTAVALSSAPSPVNGTIPEEQSPPINLPPIPSKAIAVNLDDFI